MLKKHLRSLRGVSPIIGTILMVAIAVALAATAYFTMTAIVRTPPTRQPFISMGQVGDHIEVFAVMNGPVNGSSVTITLTDENGEIPMGVTAELNFTRGADAENVDAGDIITLTGAASGEKYVVSMVYNHKVIGISKFSRE